MFDFTVSVKSDGRALLWDGNTVIGWFSSEARAFNFARRYEAGVSFSVLCDRLQAGERFDCINASDLSARFDGVIRARV